MHAKWQNTAINMVSSITANRLKLFWVSFSAPLKLMSISLLLSSETIFSVMELIWTADE